MKRTLIYILFLSGAFSMGAQTGEAGKTVSDGFTETAAETSTMAISTLDADKIEATLTSDVFQALFGTIPGLQAYQNVGWQLPSTFSIRATGGPLILVDGFQRNLRSLSANEIETVTVLKDGAAAALYGVQGSGGVLLITTKRGRKQGMKVDAEYNFGLGLPYALPQFVNAADYATAVNEALANDGLGPRYTPGEIEAWRTGSYPDEYPDVDWLKEGLRNFTTDHQLSVNFRGGGSHVRYFANIDYLRNEGLLANTDLNEKFSTQMRLNKLSARVNLDIDVTKSTLVKLNIHGCLDENHRPAGQNENFVEGFFQIPSNTFPVKTADGLWGGDGYYKRNPVADVAARGYFNNWQRLMMTDLRLIQDLSALTPGLRAEIAVAWDSRAAFTEGLNKPYQYEILNPVMDAAGQVTTSPAIQGENMDYKYNRNLKDQLMRLTLEGRIGYGRKFGKHGLSASLIYRQCGTVPVVRNDTRKFQSLLLTGGYDYAGKYVLNAAANYQGASVLFKGSRFRLYPAVSAAWVLSKEDFMKDSAFNLLKLRASYGRSGNITGQYVHNLDQLYYINRGSCYAFGAGNTAIQGVIEKYLPMERLLPELSDKTDVGVDLELHSALSLSADLFHDYRSRLLKSSDGLYSSVLGIAPPLQNVGKTEATGFDFGAAFHKETERLRYFVSGTLSYVRTKVLNAGEGFVPEEYLTAVGHPRGQVFGYEAIGFFADQADIDASPAQQFSEVRPGDIKYKDQNGDGRINAHDRVAIGHSSLYPELYYGLQFGVEYKGFGLRLDFQGTGVQTKMKATQGVHQVLGAGRGNLSEWYWSEHRRWTPETASTAELPRLTTLDNKNNTLSSTLWMEDASYFSLRNACLYWNLPKKWSKKLGMTDFRLYLKGSNLFMADKFEYTNPDSANALYPDLRRLHLGLKLRF